MSEHVIPAMLGWSNPGTDGGANVRLYASDKGNSPRWDNDSGEGGRTVERAIIERDGGLFEGDRYLVVHLGDRFTTAEREQAVVDAVEAVLGASS